MTKIYVVSALSFLLFCSVAKADETYDIATDPLNFGKFVQIDRPTIVSISTDGSRTLGAGAVAPLNSDAHSATLKTYTNQAFNGSIPAEIKFNQTHQADLGYCSASISNLQFSTTTIRTDEPTAVSVGATLKIDGYCKEGIYRGNIDVNYQLTVDEVTSDKIVRVPFEFEVEEPLSVAKDAANGDLDFGSYISPSSDSFVTLDSSGVTTTGDIIKVNSSTAHPAKIVASGTSGRGVQMTFDASSIYLYLNGDTGDDAKFLLNNFTVNSEGINGNTYDFNFPTTGDAQASKILNIGGTLRVPRGAKAGSYSGNIHIVFIYNDY